MNKKLIIMASFFLLYSGTTLNASAEVNVPLNIDLTNKISTNIASFHDFQYAVVEGNTIYVPERQGNKITAINAIDGTIKWEYATNANTAYYGFTSVGEYLFFQANGTLTVLKDSGTGATVEWTKPYHGSQFTLQGTTLYLYKSGKLAALDVTTGTENWEYTLPTRERPHSNIVVADGKIFFVTDNQMDMERKMYALNATTAQPLWTTTNVDYYAQKLQYVDGTIFVKGYKDMNAFDANNGSFIWKFAVQENFDFEMNETTIFTKTYDGYVSAYDRNTKALRWKTKVGSSLPRGPMTITATHIIVNGDGMIKWLDIQSGQIVRTMTAPGTTYQPLVAEDGTLVAIDNSNNLYYYTVANDTVLPVLNLEPLAKRFSPHEVSNTKITFHLSEDAYVKMVVKNSNGQAVRTIDFGLVNKSWNDKYWDGKDDAGVIVPYGQYTLSFIVKDLAGNEAIIENADRKLGVADLFATTVKETTARKGAGETYDVLVTIPTGVRLTITDEINGWYNVNFFVNSIGYSGFVPKSEVATRSNPEPTVSTDTGPENNVINYSVQTGDTLWKIAQKFAVSTQSIVELNKLDPAKYLYIGQKLMIPSQQVSTPVEQPVVLPEQPVTTVTHSVQTGDTLWKVAQQYGVTVQSIVDANQLDPTKYLYVGQKLSISTSKTEQQTSITYSVQTGDTLWFIAQKHSVTTQQIIDANKLDPTKYLYVGQKLVIPTKVQPTTISYTVQQGDTLWLIAQKNGVSTQSIIETNKLDPTKYLYVGQKLNIVK